MAKLRRLWRLAPVQNETERLLMDKLNISRVVAQILINRGILDEYTAKDFLFGNADKIYDPFLLKDMDKAVERIAKAVNNCEKIVIYGDYDVDGITATSLMWWMLTDLNANVDYYIPERQSEGYGLNGSALENLKKNGATLIITVDCGISAFQEIALLKDELDIIVTDHHQPPEILPPAYAIINPKQNGCPYIDKQLAGVGVAFKLCQALWQKLYPAQGPFLKYLDFVAIGTIADIVPLTDENRILVKLGLAQLATTQNTGLKALFEACGLSAGKIDTGKVGYVIAPRLNAAGRVSHAAAGVELLITNNSSKAMELAALLNQENSHRQAVEKEILAAAEATLVDVDITNAKVLVVAGENWHPGVIGIVASRLVEKYYRPVIMISIKDGLGKGSCRSIPGFDMYAALANAADLLIQFGGHRQAAGLSVESEKISLLRERLNKYAAETLTEEDYTPKINIDSLVAIEEINAALMEELACLEPYGMGNPSPVFACRQLPLADIRAIGQEKRHLKLRVRRQNAYTDVLGWDMGLMQEVLQRDDLVDIAFVPEFNDWQGQRTIQLRAHDVRPTEKIPSPIDKLYAAAIAEGKYKHVTDADRFVTKVAGVTFEGRQSTVSGLQPGEALVLTRQPNNSHDTNAIAVYTVTGDSIGYLNAALAAELAPVMDQGRDYRCVVSAVTGGNDRSFGVNIVIYRQQDRTCPVAIKPLNCNNIEDKIRQAVLGERDYHASQKAALDSLRLKMNTLALMGTGRGKSAIFQTYAALTALQDHKVTVIVYPLRALVNDQFLSLSRRMSSLGLAIYKGNGTITTEERAELFDAIKHGRADILLTTPEFLEANLSAFFNYRERIGFFVVDESHHIYHSGRKQRPVYLRLNEILRSFGNPLVLAVTATADDETAEKIESVLGIAKVVVDNTVRVNLAIEDKRCMADKFGYLRTLISDDKKTLIYVNSRKQAYDIASRLRTLRPELADRIGFYHAGLNNEWRVQVEDWFREGVVTTMVATSAFGEGIDLPDIRNVVLYHLPFNQTAFNQQCGRAGRDGNPSVIHLLFGDEDVRLNHLILQDSCPDRQAIGNVYRTLKANAINNQLVLTNVQIGEDVEVRFGVRIGQTAVAMALKVLEELELIWRETAGPKRTIHMLQAPQHKLELEGSVTFKEGLLEKESFQSFADQVMTLSADDLLTWLNRPVIPGKYKEEKSYGF